MERLKMDGDINSANTLLERQFLLDLPQDAAHVLEEFSEDEAAHTLNRHDAFVLVPVWRRLMPHVAVRLLGVLSEETAVKLLCELHPYEAARLLSATDEVKSGQYLAAMDPAIAADLRNLMSYPERSAGRLMNPIRMAFRLTMTAQDAINQLKVRSTDNLRSLFLVDADNRLASKVSIQRIAISDPDTVLRDLAEPVTAYVTPLSSQEEIADIFERDRLADLPVVDQDGLLVGIVNHAALVETIQSDSTVDIQTMVGASRDEKALSKPLFAVRKRLPWLQINLLTAFLAASVVGLFEETIAAFTALAVLLPVVAGQSGNAGAQALAVTMRGLALREISPRQWISVTFKEVNVGLINGLAVAATCGIGVYFWSGSTGLVIVIAVSMVMAMVAAGFAGAVVPIILTKLGQDPAQSSSIVLTTVTDIAGFFSFLGIAAMLSAFL